MSDSSPPRTFPLPKVFYDCKLESGYTYRPVPAYSYTLLCSKNVKTDLKRYDTCISVCELSKEKPIAKWEIDADDGDKDFLCHTLFLKQVSYRLAYASSVMVSSHRQRN